MKRRTFIHKGGAAALSTLFLLRQRAEVVSGLNNIGIQLYTVRDDMALNPGQTLNALAHMGYTHVEHTGYHQGLFYGMLPADFKSLLNDAGLVMHSGHTHTGRTNTEETHTMSNKWEEVCHHAASLGQSYLVCGYLADAERKNLDDYKKAAHLFNVCGEKAAEYGVRLLYHNHDFEFIPMENVLPYDVLLERTDPSFINFEMDLFWTRKGGVEGLDYFEKYPGRFPLWHIKDMDDSPDRFFTEVGSGVINWQKYFEEKDQAGLQFFYVEQDVCKNFPPMDSVRISIDYLKNNL